MGAKNMVIAGDYMGKPITGIGGVVQIYVDRKNYILLDKFGVDSYDVITEDTRKRCRWCGSVRTRWLAGRAIRKKQKHRHCCGPFQRRKKQPA